VIALFLISLLTACGGSDAPTASEAPPGPPAGEQIAGPMDPKVTRAIELASAVKAAPVGGAEAALAAKNSSREELDGLLYEIAADPSLSLSYASATIR
jgi:hypothetical protein